MLIGVICLLPLLLINPVTAENRKSGIKEELVHKINGIWINEDYVSGSATPYSEARWNFRADGTLEGSNRLYEGVIPFPTGTYEIEECWSDSENNSWYKIIVDCSCGGGLEVYFLVKLNAVETTLECVFSNIEYPAEIVKDSYRVSYRIYYREDAV